MSSPLKPVPNRLISYDEAVEFLFSAINFEKVSKYAYDPATLDLKRERDLLASVGDPHERQNFVHVAGTKGKGSTASMLAAILSAHGLRTGLFTSPHLVHVEERIQIDGEMMPRQRLLEVMNELAPHVDHVRDCACKEAPTYWEILTAMAFLHYLEEKCDISVIEVGLGGRLDSTNVILPKVSIVTRIDYDHTDKLGTTLTQIAGEKAAIIKEGIPAVVSSQAPEARVVFENRARETGSDLRGPCEAISVKDAERDMRPGIEVSLKGRLRDYPGLFVPVIGGHQAENVATAVAAAEVLEEQGLVKLSVEKMRCALHRLYIPGRIEVISRNPLTILDCAHNVVSARALRRAIQSRFAWERMVLLIGMSKDKDIDGFLQELAPMASRVVLTQVDMPRAADAYDLAERCRRMSHVSAEAVLGPARALRTARRGLGESDLLCITGSFYLAGKIKEVLDSEALGPQR